MKTNFVRIYVVVYEEKIVYVGSTCESLMQRLSRHYKASRLKKTAFAKFLSKEPQIQIREIEICKIEKRYERENHWINFYETKIKGYNIDTAARGRVKGCKNPTGEEHYLYGKKVSRHIVDSSVAARIGKKLSPEHKEKIRQGNLGKHYDEWARPVICVKTGEEFRTASDCAKRLGVAKQTILNICSGATKEPRGKLRGLSLKFKDELCQLQ